MHKFFETAWSVCLLENYNGSVVLYIVPGEPTTKCFVGNIIID